MEERRGYWFLLTGLIIGLLLGFTDNPQRLRAGPLECRDQIVYQRDLLGR